MKNDSGWWWNEADGLTFVVNAPKRGRYMSEKKYKISMFCIIIFSLGSHELQKHLLLFSFSKRNVQNTRENKLFNVHLKMAFMQQNKLEKKYVYLLKRLLLIFVRIFGKTVNHLPESPLTLQLLEIEKEISKNYSEK